MLKLTVFGMGTGRSIQATSPDILLSASLTALAEEEILNILVVKSSPRPISIGPLHALLHFHSRPIYLVVYKGSYQIAL